MLALPVCVNFNEDEQNGPIAPVWVHRRNTGLSSSPATRLPSSFYAENWEGLCQTS